MKCRSLLYHYNSDRVSTGVEHFFFQGWDDDVDYETLHEPLPSWIREAHQRHKGVEDAKKRRLNKRDLDVVQREAAGAAMALWDIGLRMCISYLAQDNDALFEHPPPDLLFDVSEVSATVKSALVDPENTAQLMAGSDVEEH